LEGWEDSLIKVINNASERNVQVSYYVREKEGVKGYRKAKCISLRSTQFA